MIYSTFSRALALALALILTVPALFATDELFGDEVSPTAQSAIDELKTIGLTNPGLRGSENLKRLTYSKRQVALTRNQLIRLLKDGSVTTEGNGFGYGDTDEKNVASTEYLITDGVFAFKSLVASLDAYYRAERAVELASGEKKTSLMREARTLKSDAQSAYRRFLEVINRE